MLIYNSKNNKRIDTEQSNQYSKKKLLTTLNRLGREQAQSSVEYNEY